MFTRIFMIMFIVYIFYRTAPHFEVYAPNTVPAIGKLAFAMKKDLDTVLQNHSFYLTMRSFVQNIDKKLSEYQLETNS